MITEQQRADRKLGIGGSDVAIIMGLSNYMTPVALWMQKRGALEIESSDSPQAYWGNRLEDIVRQEFALRHDCEVIQPDTIVHPSHTYMRGNIDGFIPSENAVLEIKTCNQFLSHEWGQEGAEIPPRYLVQIAYYCMLTNASKGFVAVLIGGQDYREYVYERDEWLEAEIVMACDQFWHCVERNIQPEAQYADMKYLFKAVEEKSIVYTVDLEEPIRKLQKLKNSYKQLQIEEEQAKLQIMQYMQDAEYLTDHDGKVLVSWKANKRGRTFLVKGE